MPKPDEPTDAYERRIRERAASVVRTQATALAEGTTPYRDLSQALSHIQTEYEDRFLYELLQNAYDAHGPSTVDGRIEVYLDADEGVAGVLYVANGGNPVADENLIGLTGLAHSTKNVDESVGNKGVGFRSVFRVCASPEIYSRAPGSSASRFDGFCFSYATDDDYETLVGGNRDLLASLRSDLHRSFLPVPCAERPGAIPEYAKEPGISTVIRLPLNDPASCELVSQKLRELEESDAPLHLFLDRVQRIDLLRQTDDELGCRELRRATTVVHETDTQRHEHVDLGDRGRYFVATRTVPVERMRAAIARSVGGREISTDWGEWARDATVSVAVPLDTADGSIGRMYTHLPMGDTATSPFFGHATAPFVAKLARLTIDSKIALNAMLLDECAAAAAQAAVLLADAPALLPPGALVDLLAWTDADRLAAGFEILGLELDDAALVPVGPSDGEQRVALSNALRCALPGGDSPLSHDAVVRITAAPLLTPTLGQRRGAAMASLASQRGIDLAPRDNVVATWVESVAQELDVVGADDERWSAFYRDLIDLVAATRVEEALAGRTILLTDNRALAAARRPRGETDAVAIFGAPRLGVGGDDDAAPGVPPLLESRIATFRDLAAAMGDAEYDALVDWLQTHRLIREFNRTELFRLLVQHVSASDTPEATRLSALRFAFDTISSAPREIRASGVLGGLPVPCTGGWARADSAVFGPAWATPLARKLDDLIALAPPDSDLAQIAERALVPPIGLSLEGESVERWVRFLEDCGVSDGLPLEAVDVPPRLGRHFDNFATSVLAGVPLPLPVRTAWASTAPRKHFAHRTTYRFASPPATVAGLGDLADLDERPRRLYGELLLRGLDHWPDNAMWVNILGKGGVHCRWPTPLAGAISEFEWLTTRIGRATEDRVPGRPSSVWIGSDAHDPPAFVRSLGQQLARIAAGSAVAAARLREAGARRWGDTEYAEAMLEAMAEAVIEDRVDQAVRELRVSVRLALDLLRERAASDEYDEVDDPIKRLVAFGAEGPRVIEQRDEPLYLAADEDTIGTQLLLAAGEAVVRVPPRFELEIATILRGRGWSDVRPVSEMELNVIVDGLRLEDAPSQELVDRWPWLPDLCAALVRTSRHAFSHPGTTVIQRTRTLVAAARLVPFDHLEVWNDQRSLPVPEADAIPLKGDAGGLILVKREAMGGDGLLPLLARPLSDLDGGLSPYRTDLQLAFERLLARGSDTIDASDVARAAELDPADLEAEAESHDDATTSAIRNLALVLLASGFSQAARELLDGEGEGGTVLERMRLAAATTDRPDEILVACRASDDPADLCPALGLALADLNLALNEMHLEPMDRTSAHRESVRRWIARRRGELLDELRRAWAPVARADGDISGYLDARELDVQPAPDWAFTIWQVDGDVLEGHVHSSLQAYGGVWPPDAKLRPVDEVRAEGRASIVDSWAETLVVVVAWCRKRGVDAPDLIEAEQLVAEAIDAGWLDFDACQPEDVARIAARLGRWPDDMPVTTDPGDLELTPGHLSAARDVLESRSRTRRRRVLKFADGASFDVGRATWTDLAGYVDGLLATDDIVAQLEATAVPEPMGPPALDGAGGGGGGGPRDVGALPKMSEAERVSVGLVGELIAHAWLRRLHGADFNDDCWVSAYRRARDLPEGNDSLGYDFCVETDGRRLLYEVKATTREEGQFELGSSEVRAASDAWAAPTDDYVVLFVRNILSPAQAKLVPLPNPLDPANAQLYRLGGSGLRCQFRLAE